MGQMMLLPEERDLVRPRVLPPVRPVSTWRGRSSTARRGSSCSTRRSGAAARRRTKIVDGEMEALLFLAEAFNFRRRHATAFIAWVRDTLDLRERGQQLLIEM